VKTSREISTFIYPSGANIGLPMKEADYSWIHLQPLVAA